MSPYRLAERCGYEPMPSSRKVASPSARATLSASSSAANTTTARVPMPRAAAEQRQLASRSVTPPLIAITTTVPPCRAAPRASGARLIDRVELREQRGEHRVGLVAARGRRARARRHASTRACGSAPTSRTCRPTAPPFLASAPLFAPAAGGAPAGSWTPDAAAAAPRFVSLASRGAAPSCHTQAHHVVQARLLASSTTTQFSLCSFTSTTASSSQPCAQRAVGRRAGRQRPLAVALRVREQQARLAVARLARREAREELRKDLGRAERRRRLEPEKPLRGLGRKSRPSVASGASARASARACARGRRGRARRTARTRAARARRRTAPARRKARAAHGSHAGGGGGGRRLARLRLRTPAMRRRRAGAARTVAANRAPRPAPRSADDRARVVRAETRGKAKSPRIRTRSSGAAPRTRAAQLRRRARAARRQRGSFRSCSCTPPQKLTPAPPRRDNEGGRTRRLTHIRPPCGARAPRQDRRAADAQQVCRGCVRSAERGGGWGRGGGRSGARRALASHRAAATRLAPLSRAPATVGTKLYVHGGLSAGNMSDMYAFDLITHTWKQLRTRRAAGPRRARATR